MPISAVGNRAAARPVGARRRRGFTLLELLVVVSLIAVATAGVSLAWRDSAHSRVEREAQRLAVLLDSARARSRLSGVAVRWVATVKGFRFEGLSGEPRLPEHWLEPGVIVQGAASLELGPEPLIPQQSLVLSAADASHVAWRVSSDGLRPFRIEPVASSVNVSASAGGTP